jgi:hypothetical protein
MFLIHFALLIGPVTDVHYQIFLFSYCEDHLYCLSADTAVLGLSVQYIVKHVSVAPMLAQFRNSPDDPRIQLRPAGADASRLGSALSTPLRTRAGPYGELQLSNSDA